MTPPRIIRPARTLDAAAICGIYNYYVANTTISFEDEPVSIAEMAQRIGDIVSADLPWLVLLEGDRLIGYAYATKWRARAAYRYSVESSVYVDPRQTGQGAGRMLYQALLEELRARDLHLVIGGIAQPNEASVALHERLGFRKVAHFAEVGMKFGQWRDVGYWQLQLNQSTNGPQGAHT